MTLLVRLNRYPFLFACVCHCGKRVGFECACVVYEDFLCARVGRVQHEAASRFPLS